MLVVSEIIVLLERGWISTKPGFKLPSRLLSTDRSKAVKTSIYASVCPFHVYRSTNSCRAVCRVDMSLLRFSLFLYFNILGPYAAMYEMTYHDPLKIPSNYSIYI